MSNNFIRALVLLACIVFKPAAAEPNKKLAMLRNVNALTAQLLVIAQERQTLSRKGVKRFSNENIERLVQGQHDLELLARLSAISQVYMSPGLAGDELVDDVMDETWHNCIMQIERIGGEAAITTLEKIALRQPLDGAFSLRHRTALERLKARKP